MESSDQVTVPELEEVLKEKTIDEYCKSAFASIRKSQAMLNDLKGWQLYTDYPGVHKTMKRVNSLVASLISKIFIHNDINLKLQGNSLSSKLEVLREGNDALFEKISSNLDEASGIGRNPGIEIIDTTVRTIRGPTNPETGRVMVLHASRNVQKPQLFFKDKINNSSKEPFIPLLKEKPHSLKPLSILLCIDEQQREYYSHPYEYELQHWSPSNDLFIKKEPKMPPPMETTPFTLVEDAASLQNLVEELKKADEIGVDVENHAFRSYQGLTCLIQISTREQDFIVDTLALRGHLSILNEIFADPKKTKVFHGANHDILWLQRDCGIYVVNMFDTHQAACILNYPHRSLSALLMNFCGFQPDKSYQRSDWRIRPLPEDFLTYARMDSHYLLYIYDCLQNELLEKGNELKHLLHTTYNRSTELCLMRYEKPIITPDCHLGLYRKSRKAFNSRQLYALKTLYHWRDKIAREHDESVDYVLPQHMLLQIAEVLPKEVQGILACCNPIPTLVKVEQLTLHQILQQARGQPLLEIEKSLAHIVSQEATSVIYDLSSKLLRKHDLSQVDENPSDLTTLLSTDEDTIFGDLFAQSSVSVKHKKSSFLLGNFKSAPSSSEALENKFTEEFMSPYQRYTAYLELQPFLDERRKTDEPVDTEERIQNVLGHLSSLAGQSEVENNAPSSQTSDANRMSRIFDHLTKVKEVSESDSAVISIHSQSASTERVEKLQEDITSLISELDSYVVQNPTSASEEAPTPPVAKDPPKRELKRKMSIKELRAQKEARKQKASDARASQEKGEKRKSQEAAFPLPQRLKKKPRKMRNLLQLATEAPADAATTSGGDSLQREVQPFNYEEANYRIFSKKRKKKGPRGRVAEKFKGKKSNKNPSFKKSGLKSFTWGGDGAMKTPPP